VRFDKAGMGSMGVELAKRRLRQEW